jgi:hypothetical protein
MASSLEARVASVTEHGFVRRFMRMVQIADVVSSMGDLITVAPVSGRRLSDFVTVDFVKVVPLGCRAPPRATAVCLSICLHARLPA